MWLFLIIVVGGFIVGFLADSLPKKYALIMFSAIAIIMLVGSCFMQYFGG